MTTKLSSLTSGLSTLIRQLYLSITSANFYYDVFRFYRGYGLKFIFTISFLASLIFGIHLFNYITALKNYFSSNQTSIYTGNLEYLINQLPNINYDGKNISLEEETPFYLLDQNNRKIAVLDPENKLSFNDKTRIPIILTSNKVILSLIETTDKKRSNFTIEYPSILGDNPTELTQESIKKHFANLFDSAPRVFIYLVMPLLVLLRFLSVLFEKSLIILLIYLLTNFFGLQTPMQTAIRLALFSTGVPVLIQPLIVILVPEASILIWLIQMWMNFLLMLGILKARNYSSGAP